MARENLDKIVAAYHDGTLEAELDAMHALLCTWSRDYGEEYNYRLSVITCMLADLVGIVNLQYVHSQPTEAAVGTTPDKSPESSRPRLTPEQWLRLRYPKGVWLRRFTPAVELHHQGYSVEEICRIGRISSNSHLRKALVLYAAEYPVPTTPTASPPGSPPPDRTDCESE